MNLNLFALDGDKVAEGVWFNYPRTPGVRVRVVSIENKRYQETLAAFRNQATGERRAGLSADEDNEVLLKAVAHSLLIDWNVTDKDGASVPYTAEVGLQVISDPGYKDFFNFILNKAVDLNNYARERTEEIVKT